MFLGFQKSVLSSDSIIALVSKKALHVNTSYVGAFNRLLYVFHRYI